MEKEIETLDSLSRRSDLPEKQNAQGNHLAERHFSVGELSERWNLSTDSIRRLFENEPGVIVFKNNQPYKREYKTLRIPETVAMRVYRRSTVIKA
jgi:hypothetical protein